MSALRDEGAIDQAVRAGEARRHAPALNRRGVRSGR